MAIDLTGGLSDTLNPTNWISGKLVGTIVSIAIPAVIILIILYFLHLYFIQYKYEIRIRQKIGNNVAVKKDRGKIFNLDDVMWIKTFWGKKKILFPTSCGVYKCGKVTVIEFYRNESGDFLPIHFHYETPPKHWLEENIKFEEKEDGSIDLNLDKVFPHLYPDNLNVRQAHLLRQTKIRERFLKDSAWSKIAPYAMTLLGMIISLVMVVIATKNCS